MAAAIHPNQVRLVLLRHREKHRNSFSRWTCINSDVSYHTFLVVLPFDASDSVADMVQWSNLWSGHDERQTLREETASCMVMKIFVQNGYSG